MSSDDPLSAALRRDIDSNLQAMMAQANAKPSDAERVDADIPELQVRAPLP